MYGAQADTPVPVSPLAVKWPPMFDTAPGAEAFPSTPRCGAVASTPTPLLPEAMK